MAKVLDGGRDWRWIRRIESRVRARHVPARSKRDRLVGSADLLELGVQLMEGAPALTTDRLRAMQFRDGLIIAFLAARPLRLRNLAGLELERTLVARGDGWWIDIPGEETKTREPIDVPWPEALTARSRPTSMSTARSSAGCQPLDPSGRQRPVGLDARLADGERSHLRCHRRPTATAFGRSVNPHLFRDCAATAIAIDDPAHVRVASQILGHRSAATTERYYNQAQAIEAARQYQDFLVGLRNGTMSDDPTGGEPDARRHLRPLLEREAARSLDRGSARGLPRRDRPAQGWTLLRHLTPMPPSAAPAASARRSSGCGAMPSSAAFDVVDLRGSRPLAARLADVRPSCTTALAFLGVRAVHAVAGEVTPTAHRGCIGILAQLALTDLREKTRRGQLGRVLKGRVPAASPTATALCGRQGDATRRERAINPAEAPVVEVAIFASVRQRREPARPSPSG